MNVYTVTAVFEAVDKITGTVGNIENSLTGMGKSMQKTGKTLTATLTAPILGLATVAAKTAIDFDKAMMGVNAVLKLSGDEFTAYKEEVLEFSTTTSQSSEDVALALRGIVSSGYDATDAMEVLRVAVDAAGNMMTGTENTTRALSSVLRAFGMEATDVTHVADVLETAANKSAIEFEALTGSIGNATGIAAAAGVPFETLTAGLMTVTDAGYGVEESATAMRALITALLSPTDDLAGLIGEWGYESGEAALAGMGLEGMMTQLYESTGGSAAQIGDLLGNIRASKAAFALGAEGGMNFIASLEEVAGASLGVGEHAAMADVRHQSWAYHIAKLKSEVEVFATRLVNLFIPSVIEVVDVFKDWFTALAQASPETLKMIGIIALVVAAIGPLLIVVGSLLSAAGTVAGVLGAISAPVWILIAAIALLGVAFATNFGGIRDVALEMWTQIQPHFAALCDWAQVVIPQALEALRGWFADVWADVQPIISEAVGAIQNHLAKLEPIFANVREIVAGVVAWVVEHWPQIQATIQTVMDVVGNIITTIVSEVVPFVVEMFGKVVDWVVTNWPLIKETISTVLQFVWNIVQFILNAVQTFWQAHGDAILNYVSLMWANIKLVISTVLDVILGIIRVVMQVINGDWAGAWETVCSIASTIWETIKSLLSNFLDAVIGVIESLASWLATTWEDIKVLASNTWENLRASVIEKVENLKATAIEKIENLKTWLATTWEDIKVFASDTWEDLKAAVVEKVQEVHDTVTEKIEEVRTFISEFSLYDVGAALIDSLKSGILSKAREVIDAAVDILNRAIQAVKDAVGMSSPSTVFIEIGQNLAVALATGIRSKVGDVVDAASEMLNAASTVGGLGTTAASLLQKRQIDPLRAQLEGLQSGFGAVTEQLAALYPEYQMQYGLLGLVLYERAYGEVPEELNRLAQSRLDIQQEIYGVTDDLTRMNEKLLRIEEQREKLTFLQQQVALLDLIREHGLDAAEILGGLRLGVDADLEAVIDAMVAAMEALITQTEETLGVASESKVFRYIGRQMMLGMASGIYGARDQVTAAMRSAAGETVQVAGALSRSSGGGAATYDNRRITNSQNNITVNGMGLGGMLAAAAGQV